MMRLLLTIALLLSYASAQDGCPNAPITTGSPVIINSTTDLATYASCTSLPGLIIGAGNIVGNVSFDNLQRILRTTANNGVSQAGIQILGTSATGIAFPALTSFYGTFLRIIGNPNLATLTVGGSAAVANQNAGQGTQVVIQSNPNLVSPTINIDTLGTSVGGAAGSTLSLLAIGADDVSGTGDQTGASGTVSFPYLTTITRLTLFLNGVNNNSSKQLAVSLPLVSNVAQAINIQTNSFLTSLSIPSAFTLGNQGATFQTNPNLRALSLGVTTTTGPIKFDSNGNSASLFDVNLDSLLTPSPVALTFTNNAGFRSLSLRQVLYALTFDVNTNSGLSSFNLPSGVVTSTFSFNSNGNSGSLCNAIIGIQNVTSALVSINSNYLSQLALTKVFGLTRGISIVGNVLNGPFYANNSFVAGQFTFNSATSPATSAITTFDVSGLQQATTISLNQFSGTGSANVILSKLQTVNSISITSLSGFGSIIFGSLTSVNTILISSSTFATYDFLNGGTNKWAANSISISNGQNLGNINFGNLGYAQNISVDVAGTASNSLTISGPSLACVSQFLASGSASNGISSVSFPVLKSIAAVQTIGPNGCTFTIGGATTSCNTGCYSCSGYTGSTVNCNDNNRVPSSLNPNPSTLCVSGNDAVTNNGQCPAPSTASFSTGAGATPAASSTTASPTSGGSSPTTTGGTSNTTTSGTVTGGAGTSSNTTTGASTGASSNATTGATTGATTTGSATGTTTGPTRSYASIVTVSLFAMAIAAALVL